MRLYISLSENASQAGGMGARQIGADIMHIGREIHSYRADLGQADRQSAGSAQSWSDLHSPMANLPPN